MDDNRKISELLQNPAIASLLSQFGAPQETPEAQPKRPPAPGVTGIRTGPLSGLGRTAISQTVMKLALYSPA
ncbi:MAG: hypothetical protein ACLS8R_11450 [Anaeromassilibacillus sp.]